MKHSILTLLFLLLFSLTAKSQSIDELNSFIKKQGSFIKLDSLVKSNDTVACSLPLLKKNFNKKNNNFNDFYVNPKTIEVKDSILSLNLYHIDGFKRKLELSKKEEKVRLSGNASGKDGIVKIDLKNLKIISFLRWE